MNIYFILYVLTCVLSVECSIEMAEAYLLRGHTDTKF